MTGNKFEIIGPLLGRIGGESGDVIGGSPDGIYIYAEVEQRSVYAGIFMDEGPVVRYYNPSLDLCDLILEAWEAEDEEKRWLAMEFEVDGSAVNAHFIFPEEAKPNEDAVDRRREALRKRFGDKKVEYPPIGSEFEEFE